MSRIQSPSQSRGITLIELMVAIFIGSATVLAALAWFRNVHGQHVRQRQVQAMEVSIREASKAISRYLRSSGVGSGDIAFFDPANITPAPSAGAGKAPISYNASQKKISIYGNFNGDASMLQTPMVVDLTRMHVRHPEIFQAGHCVYINAGSNQEVAKIRRIEDSVLIVDNAVRVSYPKGTSVIPFELVEIVSDGQGLSIIKKTAAGADLGQRTFAPSGRAGDRVSLQVDSLLLAERRLQYLLEFSLENAGSNNVRLSRKMEQVVYLRGI